MDLNDWRDLSLQIAVEHGFTEATFMEDICLIMTELAEAAEEFRAGKAPGEVYYEPSADPDKPAKPCGVPSELADVLIRVFHLCGKYGIDIERVTQEKTEYNHYRPYKHGKRI